MYKIAGDNKEAIRQKRSLLAAKIDMSSAGPIASHNNHHHTALFLANSHPTIISILLLCLLSVFNPMSAYGKHQTVHPKPNTQSITSQYQSTLEMKINHDSRFQDTIRIKQNANKVSGKVNTFEQVDNRLEPLVKPDDQDSRTII